MNVFHNLWITWNSWNMLLSAARDAHLNISLKQHIVHRNTSLPIILLFKNFFRKALGLLFIFSCEYGLHPLLKWQDTHFLGTWEAYPGVFKKSSLRKPNSKVCDKSAHQVFNWTHQSLPVCKAFISCIQVAFGLLTWMRKDKQIYKHTHIQKNTHFLEKISRNQVHTRLKSKIGE